MLGTLALFRSRNEGSAIVGGEENERVLCDPQVPEKAQDLPNTVVNLPDSVPIPKGRKGVREQRGHDCGDGQHTGRAGFRGEGEEKSSSQS